MLLVSYTNTPPQPPSHTNHTKTKSVSIFFIDLQVKQVMIITAFSFLVEQAKAHVLIRLL